MSFYFRRRVINTLGGRREKRSKTPSIMAKDVFNPMILPIAFIRQRITSVLEHTFRVSCPKTALLVEDRIVISRI